MIGVPIEHGCIEHLAPNTLVVLDSFVGGSLTDDVGDGNDYASDAMPHSISLMEPGTPTESSTDSSKVVHEYDERLTIKVEGD